MVKDNGSQVIIALSVAIGIFVIAILLPKLVISGAVATIATTQGLELLLSLLAIVILGKARIRDYGICLPRGKSQWILIAASAPFLGIAATIAVLGFGGSGNEIVKQLSFPQVILFVWVLSSIIEEVFTRGFLLGHLSALSGKYARFLFFRIEWPVLISALFFGCMHLVLLISGTDVTTTVIVILFTFSLGLLAGYLRSVTGSLIPAIAAHLLANVGGFIGGVIYTVFTLITGGGPAGM